VEVSGNRLHPTQKPLCALTPLIESFSRPGGLGLVVDPFRGSASALLAAKLAGRRHFGIESSFFFRGVRSGGRKKKNCTNARVCEQYSSVSLAPRIPGDSGGREELIFGRSSRGTTAGHVPAAGSKRKMR